MESKYYTPSIDEFYVGFEYEQHDPIEGTNMRLREWVKKTCDVEFFYTVGWYTQEDWSLFRIKYLDREDIESLGFKWDGECYIYSLSEDKINELGLFPYNKHLEMYFKPDGFINIIWQPDSIFRGYIKNKSELKKLLKMLNIM